MSDARAPLITPEPVLENITRACARNPAVQAVGIDPHVLEVL